MFASSILSKLQFGYQNSPGSFRLVEYSTSLLVPICSVVLLYAVEQLLLSIPEVAAFQWWVNGFPYIHRLRARSWKHYQVVLWGVVLKLIALLMLMSFMFLVSLIYCTNSTSKCCAFSPISFSSDCLLNITVRTVTSYPLTQHRFHCSCKVLWDLLGWKALHKCKVLLYCPAPKACIDITLTINRW